MSSESPTRSILVGVNRRMTIDELLSIALVHDGKLEMIELSEEQTKKLEESKIEFDFEKAAFDDNSEKLSENNSLAVLSVLCLTLSQCRLLPTTQSYALSAALISMTQQTEELVLPKDPVQLSTYLSDGFVSTDEKVQTFLKETLPKIIKRIIPLSLGALAAGYARVLVCASDYVAALSAERLCVDASKAYSDKLFDVFRPHRGCITSAATLRAILQGSRQNGTASSSLEMVEATKNTPQYHGPARDIILTVCKTMELELNCSETSAEKELDNTIVETSCVSLLNVINVLLKGSLSRSSSSPVDPEEADVADKIMTLKESLENEVLLNVENIHTKVLVKIEQTKQKEAEKAKRAAEIAASQKNTDKKDEFEGMSEAQKKKILKKRAEKEAKAAAKKKKKSGAAGSGATGAESVYISTVSSMFGEGVGPLLTIFSPKITSDAKEISGEMISSLTPGTIEKATAYVDKLLSGGVQRKPKIPKGTRDYLPEQMMIRQQAFQIIRRVFESHGAVEIDTPVFELKETLTGKYGEDSKLIYDLADQGGELLALRYDLTVPFARFLSLNPVGNIKRFHIGKVYRRDKPVLAKGRYREFYQCDFDIAGVYGRMIPDSECLCVACEILDNLPIGDFGIKLNHRKLLDAILDLCGVPSDKFRTICSAVDKLDKEPWEEVKREMVEDKGLKPEVADKIGVFVLQKGNPWDLYKSLMDSKQFGTHEGALTAMEDLRILFEYLEAMGKLKFISFDLSLARGLDYYTGVIYEAVCMSGTTQVGSIGGGGRYDNLVSMFQEAGKITPCVGVSVGIERVFTLMEARLREQSKDGTVPKPNVNVLIASAGSSLVTEKMKIAKILWDSKISAEFNQSQNVKLKNEITSALDREIPFMVVVGEEEAKENKCKLKDLKSRTEELISVDDLVVELKKKGVIPVGCEFAKELMDNMP